MSDCGHIGVEEAIAQGQRMLIASEQAADREIGRLRDAVSNAHATALAEAAERVRALACECASHESCTADCHADGQNLLESLGVLAVLAILEER